MVLQIVLNNKHMRKNLQKLFGLGFLCLALSVSAQQKPITGQVLDSDGFPVQDAYVYDEETGEGVYTDADGNFTLNTEVGDTVKVEFIGFDTKTITVSGANAYNVTLAQGGAVALKEVSTLGYGIKESQDQRTTSYSQVGAEDIEKVGATSFDQALQGQVPGLEVYSVSGQPGAASPMYIRGITSLTSSSQPLVVVDGVPVSSGDLAGLATTSNALAGIDPATIESIRVLKDAAATSLYGSRGANGVILVTLKKGSKGKARMTFSSEIGFQDAAYDEGKVLNAQEHADYVATALYNRYNGILFSSFDEAYAYNYMGWDGVTDTNWKEAVRNSNPEIKKYSFSYSGGTDKMTISSALSYQWQEGVAIESSFERLSAYLGTTYQATDKLKLGSSISLSRVKLQGPSVGSSFSNPIFMGYSMSPTQSIYNADGSYNLDLTWIGGGDFNPIAIAKTNINDAKIYKVMTSLNADYEIVPALTFSTNFGFDFNYYDELQWWNPVFGDGVNDGDDNGNGEGYKYDYNYLNWSFTNSLNYNKTFADVHQVSATLAVEASQIDRQQARAGAQGYVAGYYLPELTNAANPITAYSYSSGSSFSSYLGRLAYTFDDKYTASYNIRRDGSSRFGSDTRYGVFMGGGLAWNADKEEFIKDLGFINSLKFRGSYGEVGNSGSSANDYTWRALYGISAGDYNGASGGYITSAGNPDLEWETTKTIDVGVDFGFLNNRISGSFDWYRKKAEDLLLDRELAPSGSGLTTNTSNVGESEAKGIEALLKFDIFRDTEFKWNISLNYAYNQNKVLSLADNQEVSIGGYKRLTVGHDPTEFRTRLWAGVDSSNGEALWYTDATRTTTTNDSSQAELVMTGENAMPAHIAGLSSSMSYKGFSLNLQFSYKGDYSVYDVWGFVTQSSGAYGASNTIATTYYDAWTPTNTDAKYPKIVWGDPQDSNAGSTRYLYDADHIRLRSAELGYTLKDDALTENTGISNIYFYIRGTNLYTWVFDDDLYFDPEVADNGYTTNLEGMGLFDLSAPSMRQFLLGVKVNF